MRRRDDREAEGGALLRRYAGLNLHRGFESLSLRQVKSTYGVKSKACEYFPASFCSPRGLITRFAVRSLVLLP